jgi:leucyl aminopeptidase (aminopeptidase T)
MMTATRHKEEPSSAIATVMRYFDVIVAITKYSISHTTARKRASAAGARIAALLDIDDRMLAEGGLNANFVDIARTIQRLHKVVKNCEKITLTTPIGTNLSINIKKRDWITADTGLCRQKGHFTTLPAGEIFVAPLEGSATGTLVIDGAFGNMIVEEPIEVKIKNGYAIEFKGGGEVVKELERCGREGKNLAEFGIGLNPTAILCGNPQEDEKVLGTVHIGFGENSTFGGRVSCGIHVDAIIKEPTVTIDKNLIYEGGILKI